jgi:hypothetical protein
MIDEDKTPKTAGIVPAQRGPLSVLQFSDGSDHDAVVDAAGEVAFDNIQPMTTDQDHRLNRLARATQDFLTALVSLVRPGPERSTAISRAREAKMWGAVAIALEDTEGWDVRQGARDDAGGGS